LFPLIAYFHVALTAIFASGRENDFNAQAEPPYEHVLMSKSQTLDWLNIFGY